MFISLFFFLIVVTSCKRCWRETHDGLLKWFDFITMLKKYQPQCRYKYCENIRKTCLKVHTHCTGGGEGKFSSFTFSHVLTVGVSTSAACKDLICFCLLRWQKVSQSDRVKHRSDCQNTVLIKTRLRLCPLNTLFISSSGVQDAPSIEVSQWWSSEPSPFHFSSCFWCSFLEVISVHNTLVTH